MIFTAPVFLFLFLPVLLGLLCVAPKRTHNALLLSASLLFYAWGEPALVLLMLLSLAINYGLGLALAVNPESRFNRWIMLVAVVVNLGILIHFKYASFLAEAVNALMLSLGIDGFHLDAVKTKLPIGISFYTFQALSYVIDVYTGKAKVQRNPLNLALYIALFPQLIAGPIVRYTDVAAQIRSRTITVLGFSQGAQRFIIGLGKKVLIANQAAIFADIAFDTPASQLGTSVAWLGIACYTIQIYFDFSGYSDMAIGLGAMFGFRIPENFNYPYIARSITDFWRRWHISLSSWFRDYVYIPLGGNRGRPWRTYMNLMVVFLLCGLWHGASWNFVVWGAIHGGFLIVERRWLADFLATCPRFLTHAYTLVAVMTGWVFFRAADLGQAIAYFEVLAGLRGAEVSRIVIVPNLGLFLLMAAGILGATPFIPKLLAAIDRKRQTSSAPITSFSTPAWGLFRMLSNFAILLMSVSATLSGTYDPFIYFRF